jgi:AraC-like DNA-binding protein
MNWEAHPSLLFLPVGRRQAQTGETDCAYRPVRIEEVSATRAAEAEIYTLWARSRENGYLRVMAEPDTVLGVAVHNTLDASAHSILLRADAPRKLTLVRVRRSMCRLLADIPDVLVVACPARAQVTLQALARESDGHQLYLAAKILELLSLFALAATESRPTMPPEQRAAIILQGDPASPPSAKVLAAMCGASTATLTRRFRAAFGATLREYLRDLRLECARDLLERQGVSVTEAALSVGYESLPSFSRVFHARFGYPPVSFRSKTGRS